MLFQLTDLGLDGVPELIICPSTTLGRDVTPSLALGDAVRDTATSTNAQGFNPTPTMVDRFLTWTEITLRNSGRHFLSRLVLDVVIYSTFAFFFSSSISRTSSFNSVYISSCASPLPHSRRRGQHVMDHVCRVILVTFQFFNKARNTV